MTQICFHFNADDRLAAACRLICRLYRSGNRLSVLTDEQGVDEVDTALWTFSRTDFVPHERAAAMTTALDSDPVWVASDSALLPQDCVLISLQDEVPAGFERFGHLHELVGRGEQDRHRARLRWRHYADRGYAIETIDLAASGGSP